MAQKKAYALDPMRVSCENEARKIVLEWFKGRKLAIDEFSINVVWFAYLNNGFKCMLTSNMYENNFFEITVNKITGETYCSCFERFEYIVKPSNYKEPIVMDDDYSLI